VKRPKRGAAGAATGELPRAFARGFVATALLATLQDRPARGAAPLPGRSILRHAIQGGTALAAGSVAADALLRRDYVLALAAATAGAAGVLAAEYLLNPAGESAGDRRVEKENGHGREEE
jgi:hypothetical protein